LGKRSTVYHRIVSPEKWESVSQKNKDLLNEFLNYLRSANKSPATIAQYEAQLRTFFVFMLERCENKFFVDLKKREFVKYFGYLTNELEVSPNRICSIRAVLSSLSNFIERIMDEDYPQFRNLVKVLEPVDKAFVRERPVLTMDQIKECLEKLEADKKYQVAACLAVLAASGMRKSEIIQMKMEYFEKDRLIYNGLAYETDKIRTKGRGKAGKVVTRIVFRNLVDLDHYIDLWRKKREELGIKDEWMFVVYHDGSYEQATQSTINSFARTIGRYLGEDFFVHNVRHTTSTALELAGYPIDVVQTIFRWADPKMVKYYSNISDTQSLEKFFANSKFIKENEEGEKIDGK